MASFDKLRGIVSLSAASIALLHTSNSANGEEPIVGPNSLNGQLTSKTENLILEPPLQKALLQLYADHTSHASHSSHSSHVSGASDYGYSTPSTYYAQPIAPVRKQTNSVPPNLPVFATTNSVNATNGSISQVMSNSTHIDDLTKQAAAGSSYAQYSLGICYLYGRDGAEKNAEKAKMLLELSAVQGNAFAKTRLLELTQSKTNSP